LLPQFAERVRFEVALFQIEAAWLATPTKLPAWLVL
jgi:hypothetical protein